MIERILQDLHTASLTFAIINAVLTIAMLVDLVLGIAKSKIAGKPIQSFRARKSAVKMISYYGSLLMCFLCDLNFILCDIYETPYLAMIIGGCLVLIEIKSWFEKLSDKEQARVEHSAKVMATAIKGLVPNVNVSAIVDGIAEIPSDKPEEGDNSSNTDKNTEAEQE